MKIALFFMCLTSWATAQSVDSIAVVAMQHTVEFLASDSLQGRFPGTSFEAVAAEFIQSELSQAHFKVRKQRFRFTYENTEYKSQNVIGFINNKKDSTILISAHYDHLGHGEFKALDASKEVHNGADDNASGVALMLQLAHDLNDSLKNYNLLIVAYSGHELGLYGSQHFYTRFRRKYKTLALCLNFDMVGRMDDYHKCYYQSSGGLTLDSLISTNERVNWSLSTKDRLSTLDSKWFSEAGIPSLTISTGMHLDYHKASDDTKYINYDGLLRIRNDLFDWLLSY